MKLSVPVAAIVALCTLLISPRALAATPDFAAIEPAPSEVAPEVLFRDATDALIADRATDAIARFEALGDRGVVDAVVSFNRGLAYAARVRAGRAAENPGDLGRAAHAFEEAREITHDASLSAQANQALTIVRAEIAKRRARLTQGRDGDSELEGGRPLGRSIVRWLPERDWAGLACASALALLVGLTVRVYAANKRRAAVAGTTMSIISACFWVLTSLALAVARNERLSVREGVVVAPSAHLLDDRHVALGALPPLTEGVRVEVLDESADYTRIRSMRTGVTGWLPSSSVLPLAK